MQSPSAAYDRHIARYNTGPNGSNGSFIDTYFYRRVASRDLKTVQTLIQAARDNNRASVRNARPLDVLEALFIAGLLGDRELAGRISINLDTKKVQFCNSGTQYVLGLVEGGHIQMANEFVASFNKPYIRLWSRFTHRQRVIQAICPDFVF